MRLLDKVELTNTRRKLKELETLYKARESDAAEDLELREMTLQSLQRLINQLKEEIMQSEIKQVSHR